MEPTSTAPEPTPTAPATTRAATPPGDRHPKLRALLHRRSIWLIAALIVACAGWFGYHWTFGKATVRYSTASVERGDVESTVVAAGIVQPFNYVDVGAQTSGKLKSLKVKRGDQVEKDQLLAEIDPILAATALASDRAALDNMTSQHALKQAQLALTTLQADRNDTLYAHELISANDRDITLAAYKVAFADAASINAQIKEATSAVNTGKANLGYTKITAPMGGEIVSISLLEGQTLNANQSAPNILRIGDIDTVTVWAQVSEADIVRVKPGLDVYFTILGDSVRWNGTVRQILPTPELINNVVFYDVLFDIPNPKRELKIQMTAQVFIVLARVKGVLLIPAAAIGNAGEGTEARVQVLKDDGKVESRTIKIGIKSEISAEVTDGLMEKERVVIGQTAAEGGNTKSALSTRKGP